VRLVYAYAGFSLGVAAFFLYLAAAGLRTPDVPLGGYLVNLFDIVVLAFIAFTIYVVYRLGAQRRP